MRNEALGSCFTHRESLAHSLKRLWTVHSDFASLQLFGWFNEIIEFSTLFLRNTYHCVHKELQMLHISISSLFMLQSQLIFFFLSRSSSNWYLEKWGGGIQRGVLGRAGTMLGSLEVFHYYLRKSTCWLTDLWKVETGNWIREPETAIETRQDAGVPWPSVLSSVSVDNNTHLTVGDPQWESLGSLLINDPTLMSVPRASHPTGLGWDLIIMFQEAPRGPGCYVGVLRNTLWDILCLCSLAVCKTHS